MVVNFADLGKLTLKTEGGKAERQHDIVEFLKILRNLLHQVLLEVSI